MWWRNQEENWNGWGCFSEVAENCEKQQAIIRHKKTDIRLTCKPILTYSSESWTVSSQIEERLQVSEMWFCWRMLKTSWAHWMSNELVLRRAETKWTLLMIIRKRHIEFLSHIMRKNGLEELILTGSVDGKRSRGKQREKCITNLSKWVAKQLPRREKGNKSVKSCKGQKYVEIYDCTNP